MKHIVRLATVRNKSAVHKWEPVRNQSGCVKLAGVLNYGGQSSPLTSPVMREIIGDQASESILFNHKS